MATGTLRARGKKPRRLGHRDHGCDLSYEEFWARDYKKGYRYELIEGQLHVSDFPEYSHDWMRTHVYQTLTLFAMRQRHVIGWHSHRACVLIPRRAPTSCVSPDASIYRSIPPGRNVEWKDISPLIVVEVASDDTSEKDYVIKVELYQAVPSIREYWLFDRYCEDDGPTLRVYHRGTARQKWKIAEYGPKDTYTTALLPGFKLPVCPPK